MRTHFGDGRDWFLNNRFGLFVHWGIYAVPAWHEQLQWRGHVARSEYVTLIDKFNPVNFDPDAWLDLAESVGMRYIVLTTKHHDGFCLWDTQQTDYNVMNTPYGKDIVGMLAEACHRRGFTLGFYYSVVDWHQPNYPNQGRSHELAGPLPGDEPNLNKYKEFLRAQVRELCTQYGELGVWWWDMNVTGDVDPSINDMIRELQPNAVINGRGFDEGDFGTPERDYHEDAEGINELERLTEACQAVGSESWGYKEDEDYYSKRHLMMSIDKYMARGANYLLNVGPRADGTIDPRSTDILRSIGAWYQAVKEGLLDVEPASGLTTNEDVLLTRRGNTLYVHLYKTPIRERVQLKPLAILPRKATLLNDGRELDVRVDPVPSDHEDGGSYLRIRGLPVDDMADTVMVVKLEFEHLDV